MKLFKNRVFIGIMCLALAAIISFVAVPIINSFASSTTIVVRAVQDVTMGTRITEDHIEEIEMGKKNLPAGTVFKKADVIGKYFITDINKGDIILISKIATSLILPEAKIRSMAFDESAVEIKLAGATNQRLLPNDIVTIYEKTDSGVRLIPELKYVSVVVTKTKDGTEIIKANQTASNGKPLSAETVMFIVNEKQAQKLLSLQGRMSFVLKYRGNSSAIIRRYLDEQAAYFNPSSTTENATSSEQNEEDQSDLY